MSIVISLSLSDIDSGKRLRTTDQDYVEFLAASIGERGLTNPITVGEKDKNGKHPLLAGKHRLEAVSILGWSEITAIVDPAKDELEQKLVEIDENLFRRELSVLDRAVFLAQRQEIYGILFPDTKAGTAGAAAKNGTQTTTLSFAKNVSDKMGISDRSIQRAVRRANKITPEVRQRIATTWIAEKGNELDALVKLTPEMQMACVNVMLRENEPAKNTAAALKELRGDTEENGLSAQEKELAALKLHLARVSEITRDKFIEYMRELGLV